MSKTLLRPLRLFAATPSLRFGLYCRDYDGINVI